jgi:hypothetical protein
MGKLDAEKEIQAGPDQILLCKGFAEAYDTLQGGDVKKAQVLFQALLEKFPGDYPTQLYLKRLQNP